MDKNELLEVLGRKEPAEEESILEVRAYLREHKHEAREIATSKLFADWISINKGTIEDLGRQGML